MFICVKLPFGDLNSNPCPLNPTSTYTYGMTITVVKLLHLLWNNYYNLFRDK